MLRTMMTAVPILMISAGTAMAAPTFVTPLERTTNLDPRDGDDPFDSRIEFGFYTLGVATQKIDDFGAMLVVILVTSGSWGCEQLIDVRTISNGGF